MYMFARNTIKTTLKKNVISKNNKPFFEKYKIK